MADITLQQFLKKIDSLPRELVSKGGGPLLKAMRKEANAWRDQAAANLSGRGPGNLPKNAPKGLRLGQSIKVKLDAEPSRDGFDLRHFIGYEQKAYWGAFVELGTIKQSAKPFLRPVIDQVGSGSIERIAADVEKQIETIARKAQN